MIDDINTREKGHILTIEDPIEFVHMRKNCLISQREIGVHATSFSSALLSALREDPDVILVGELRDLETMSIAVTAAEMGILVMGTLHTNGAAATVDRLVNAFPADKQPHVRTMLSTSLRGVVSQQLIPKADKTGPRRRARDPDQHPGDRQSDSPGQDGSAGKRACKPARPSGMRLMDAAIQALLDQRLITRQGSLQEGDQQVPIRAVPRGVVSSARRHRGASRLRERRRERCKLSRWPANSSSPPRCPTPTARSTSAISWSTSRPTSGCASSGCSEMSCISSARTTRTARRSCSRPKPRASPRRSWLRASPPTGPDTCTAFTSASIIGIRRIRRRTWRFPRTSTAG